MGDSGAHLRNQWAFEVEILSSAAEVVRKVHSALGAKADEIVATASGNLTLDEYKRRYVQSVRVYVDASMKRCNYGLTGALQSAYAPSYSSAYDQFVHVDCTELSYQFGYAVDGEYTAYYRGDFLKPYRAQCRSMAAAQPETYLALPDTSPDAGSLTANYSLRVDADGRQTEPLVRALRLHPAVSGENDRLQAFVPSQEPDVKTTFAADPREPPLVAATCGAATERANPDLGGTPFRFATSVTGFVVDQHGHPAPSTLSADGRALEITARSTGGHCVWVALVPPTDGIDLEYAP